MQILFKFLKMVVQISLSRKWLMREILKVCDASIEHLQEITLIQSFSFGV